MAMSKMSGFRIREMGGIDMTRQCRGLCKNNEEFFAYTRLPYDKGSRCSVCSEDDGTDEVWVRIPTHKKFVGQAPGDDLYVATTNEGNSEGHYYDITGKQHDVLVLLPVKQIAWRTNDEEGMFIKMIDEIVSAVKCPCCHTVCRAGPLSKIKKSREYIPSDRPRGRPPKDINADRINEEDVDHWVKIINLTKNTMFEQTWEDAPSSLRSQVKRRILQNEEGKETSHVT